MRSFNKSSLKKTKQIILNNSLHASTQKSSDINSLFSVRGPVCLSFFFPPSHVKSSSSPAFSLSLFFFFLKPAYGFLHLPFFSRCWNFLSLRAHVSLHWITRLPLSATTPLWPGESSSFPSSRYFFPGLILGHLQATSLARTHRNWSPRRMRLSPCL